MTDPNFGGLDGLRVNHPELEAAAQAMYQTAKDMNARLDQLESDARQYVLTWAETSAQRQSWDQAKLAWDWAMKELLDLLDGVSQTTYQSNADYIQADKRGAGRF
ncbi:MULTISPECIES: WXG100 family type VII secretion target [unclassified Nocardioides]|uniref:WXG100 family type VII secretion target n=1 Tax=unclassified Nocardioides TaxID=2615069 RepID=UPI00116FEE0F|nr:MULTISPECIES: WXG100 family type VII secretion target [unclassified Nocardioides]TQK73248.1 WXG100 family type VII secretion target [Nocardioides sp. SLBN-35]WGY02515.1 WXG100 family type VII secretion target [Nocardioides sp. QY071]